MNLNLPGMEGAAAWWSALDSRERRVLLAGGGLLAVLLAVFLFWLPLEERLETARDLLTERQETLRWMRDAADEVRLLRAAGVASRSVQSTSESLLSLGDRTARESGLGEALQRVEPESADRVRFQFDKVSFDALLGWLAMLESRFGIRADQVSIEKGEAPGQVRARLVLAWHSE